MQDDQDTPQQQQQSDDGGEALENKSESVKTGLRPANPDRLHRPANPDRL